MSVSADDVLAGRAWCVLPADGYQLLADMAEASVAHVLTDPPYDKRTHRGARTTAGAAEGVGSFAALSDPAALAPMLLRVAARWAVAFGTVEAMGDYARGAGDAWVRAGVWDKIAPSPQLTGDRPGQAVEALAIMHRAGRKKWNRGGGAGIWRVCVEHGAARPEHETPKPLALMLSLVADFTDPGDVVLDPFAGSGTTGAACLRLGRRFIGVEIDPVSATFARERLEAEAAGTTWQASRAGQTPLFG